MEKKEAPMRIEIMGLLGVISMSLTGCVTEKTVLTNDQGQTKTCETKGRIGIVSGVILHERHKNCIDKAKAEGYKEASPTASAS
jgi:hypothetical protein